MAAQLVQMVTVVDKSGKAVKSSKHVVNVWKEAKAAYKERKAEVVANRYGAEHGNTSTVDGRSQASSRGHSRPHRRHRSHEDRRRSTSSVAPSSTSPTTSYASSPRTSFEQRGQSARTMPGIQRSMTDTDGGLNMIRAPPLPARSYTSPSSPTIDMDLAYGDLPGSMPMSTRAEEQEMKGLVNTVKRLLEEADCLQHSATKTIAMLQKNPEAMAAVALTLAEISNIARTMAPSAVASMSRGAPAVFSLLASPQFLIAGGVAVGLTVVAFGGFKVIKQIRSKQAGEEKGMQELLEVNTDVSGIDSWRRGIAEEQASSVGTSVDGEFITPQAAALSRLNLEDTSRTTRRGSESRKHHSSGSSSRRHSRSSSKSSSKADSSASTTEKASSIGSERARREKKMKKPSPLRLMFH